MTTYKKALVLSGGSVKGAYQAGALRQALKHFNPEAIYGISVGSLNGAFLASRANTRIKNGQPIVWAEIAEELYQFWIAEIKQPKDIVEKRNILKLGLGFLTKSWNGLYTNDPLNNKIQKAVDETVFNQPNAVYLQVGSVDLITGAVVYADHTTEGGLKAHVLSSAAIPFIMPTSQINVGGKSHPFLDGGLRDSSPLGQTINNGAEEVLCIYCHPEKLKVEEGLCAGKFKDYANRVMDIISNENINNDHKIGTLINDLLKAGVGDSPGSPLAGKRPIEGIENPIRPMMQLEIDIEDFNAGDIMRLMNLGEADAKAHFALV
jgi:NTE family protein